MEEGASAPAAAKINLALHVLARRDDGYHEVESLIAFAEVADRVTIRPAAARAMHMAGPLADALQRSGAPSDNLAWRAVDAFRARFGGPDWAIALEKHLPLAAGIGGGSADAAATLRLLADHAGITRDDPGLVAIARGLGADVSACLLDRPCLARGIGEILDPLQHLTEASLLLVNPGVAVPTAMVFRGWSAAVEPAPPPIGRAAIEAATDAASLAAAISGSANMLQPAAIRVAPQIGTALELLRESYGCLLARMSGSGATCFGLYADAAATHAAAGQLQARHPDWWVRATRLCGWPR